MTSNASDSLRIYNLFPRLFSSIREWTSHLDRVAEMNFNAVYVNPFHRTGGSRSLYAVSDYYSVNPEFCGGQSDGFAQLKSFLEKAKSQGMMVIMDQVINHTANESTLVSEHPRWYKRDGGGNLVHPFAIDPANPSTVTVWGDLAEIDYDNNPEFDGLRAYWDAMIDFYQQMGFSGFRCDAAYKVPCAMWSPLISGAKRRDPNTVFLAETLGCTLDQTRALRSCGFDYFFNSSKWWNFEGSWCIDQHAAFKSIAPSISFPESHDTSRVASDQPGTLEYQKNRYVLSTIFSKAMMMPMGYELGATRRLDVVHSRPDHDLGGKWDLTRWVAQVNAFKAYSADLCEEGAWEPVWGFDDHILFLMRHCNDGSGAKGVLVNKDWYNPTTVSRTGFPWQFGRFSSQVRLFGDTVNIRPLQEGIDLAPSEIVLFSD